MAEVRDGQRLARWRESLPRTRNAPIAARSLSLALGWEQTRWTSLEKLPQWSMFQRAEVERGVRTLAGWLDGADADAHVAHVLEGVPVPKATAWREGMCPALPMGRPLGTGRPLARGDGGEGGSRERPILPDPLRRSQAEVILRHLQRGVVDVETALQAIADLFDPLLRYYNKTPDPTTDFA